MKYIYLSIMVLFLSACSITPYGTVVRDTIRVKGAQAMDNGVKNSLWYLCNAASVGSIQRMFGTSVARAELYKQMCKGQLDANIVGVKNK